MARLMTDSERGAFWEALKRAYPHPHCELNWHNPFALMMAIILSAQSTDKTVNKITDKLFSVADTPRAVVALGEDGLKVYTRSINYYNNKTHHIVELAKTVLAKYDGKIPHDFDTLITLPGVGRKTANVFLNIVDHAPNIGVDTHVFRLCHRLKICIGKTPADIEKKLHKLVPPDLKPDVSLALVLHGRYICTARKPHCDKCPLYDVCPADVKEVRP